MKIGVPKEIAAHETRVALIPSMIADLKKAGNEIYIEKEAGRLSLITDQQYAEAGAVILNDSKELYGTCDVILKVQPPTYSKPFKMHEVDLMQQGASLIGFLAPLDHLPLIGKLVEHKITAFAMEFVPRITRAQSMDALSSMALLAGYKAVLIAANSLGKIFPLTMTAAGTIAPATVFVLGAGVAGLQAIAIAKKLGAKVEAFDPRPAVKEQVKSLGGKFIEMELPEENVESSAGYAKEQSDLFLQKEQEAIAARLPKVDVVITTARIFGKKAPLLITKEMVELMPAGSIIIDLAAAQGGNCALTEADRIVEHRGVHIHGVTNLPATLPVHASQMYSKNITNLFEQLFLENAFNFEDEITKGSCITHQGKIVNPLVKERFNSKETDHA